MELRNPLLWLTYLALWLESQLPEHRTHTLMARRCPNFCSKFLSEASVPSSRTYLKSTLSLEQSNAQLCQAKRCHLPQDSFYCDLVESSKGKTVGKNEKKSYVSPQNGEEKCSTVASLSRSDGRAARVEGVRSLAWSLATQESGAHISSDTPIHFHCASLLFVQLQLALKLRECILKCFQFLHSVLTFTYIGQILFSFVLTLLLSAQRVLMPYQD